MWYPNDYDIVKTRHSMIFNPGLQLFYNPRVEYLNKNNPKGFFPTSRTTTAAIRNGQQRNGLKRKTISAAIFEYWKLYCFKTHVHGMKYLADDKLHLIEKLLMLIVVILYMFGTVYVCVLFSYKFKESALQIEIESTSYPVYYIVFPALTICNYNRLNWSRITEAQKKFLPSNSTQQTIDLFRQFIAQFETFSFGSFSVFGKFQNKTVKELDRINITEVIEFLSYRCDELFQACWWKDQFVSCCELFILQKSESGFCLTFNSMTSQNAIKKQKSDLFYPWHVAKAGFNSALKVYIVLDKNKRSPFNNDTNNGVAIINHGSYEWPLKEQFIPENTNVSISVDGKLSYAGVDTYAMNPDVRDCLFHNEPKYQFKYKTLPGFKYSKSNCIAQCHQQFMYGICNCSLELLYPIDGNQDTCRASDFKCLYEFRNVLNQDREPDEELYINYTNNGIKCRCLSDCYSVDFDSKILPVSITNINTKSNLGYMSIDLFYEKNSIIKYRIDFAFGIMDLLVAYGGIAGLFLGFTLFSGVELIYYLTLGLWTHLYNNKHVDDVKDDIAANNENNFNEKIFQSKNERKNMIGNKNNIKVLKLNIKPANQAKVTDITNIT